MPHPTQRRPVPVSGRRRPVRGVGSSARSWGRGPAPRPAGLPIRPTPRAAGSGACAHAPRPPGAGAPAGPHRRPGPRRDSAVRIHTTRGPGHEPDGQGAARRRPPSPRGVAPALADPEARLGRSSGPARRWLRGPATGHGSGRPFLDLADIAEDDPLPAVRSDRSLGRRPARPRLSPRKASAGRGSWLAPTTESTGAAPASGPRRLVRGARRRRRGGGRRGPRWARGRSSPAPGVGGGSGRSTRSHRRCWERRFIRLGAKMTIHATAMMITRIMGISSSTYAPCTKTLTTGN